MKKSILKLFTTIRQYIRYCRNEASYRRFISSGCRPWTKGYDIYKWRKIAEALTSESFDKILGKEGFGYRIDERIVEYPWLFSRLPDSSGILLDAGSALNHKQLIAHPKLAGKKIFISTLAPEGQAFWENGVSYIYEDICNTNLKKETFDYIACISTIEHVGLDNSFLYTGDKSHKKNKPELIYSFLTELHALLKPGGKLYLSLPFGKRAMRGWFQVFDAEQLDSIIQHFAPSDYTETIFQYASDVWGLSTREKAKDAICFDINTQKEYEVDFVAFSQSVVCLELTK